MMNIIDQIKAVTDKYPSLSVTPNEDGYTLIGTITMSKTYNDVPLYDDYHLKIVVTSDFPEHIPSVFDINDDIPNDFNHFLTDGSFCLGVFCDLRSFLDTHPSLLCFIDEIVMSYLYSASYFRIYGTFPYGDRSHGAEGKLEAYRERYGTDNDRILAYLLFYLIEEIPYRGHSICPCGSGKKIRNCHGIQLIQDIRSPYRKYFQSDAYDVLDYLATQGERRLKRENGKRRSAESSF